eukprot:1521352-Amphidinium_carterae.1
MQKGHFDMNLGLCTTLLTASGGKRLDLGTWRCKLHQRRAAGEDLSCDSKSLPGGVWVQAGMSICEDLEL